MGRGSGFILGLLGIVLPGYLFYITYESILGTITLLSNQGFFYLFGYVRFPNGRTETELEVINRDWFSANHWGGNTEFYLYLASFALAVFALIVILGSDGVGSFLFLIAGLLNLALLVVTYNNMEAIFQVPVLSGYPIPVGSIFLLLAGLFGRRD